jgi:hypothetical protein
MILGFISLNSQMVREWKTVAKGHFNDSYFRKESAVCDGQYLVATTRPDAYTPQNMFDSSYVLFSQDSGKTWQGILKLGEEPLDSSIKNWTELRFNHVEMPSKNSIVIFGTYVIWGNWSNRISFMCKTTDTGKTWKLLRPVLDSLNPYYESQSMLDSNFGILLLSKTATENSPQSKMLFKTEDGCNTWTEVSFNESATLIQKCFSKDYWVLSKSDSLIITTDGGKSWQSYAKPKWVYGISFFDEKNWLAVVVTKIQETPVVKTCSIYKTKNAGVDWELVSTINPYPYPYYADPDFYDQNNGVIGGYAYDELVRTTDGGLTWTNEILPPESYGNPFNNVKFFAEERAIGVTLKSIYLYTGKTVLRPPGVQYSKKTGELWDYRFFWNKILGAKKYKVQIAESRPDIYDGRFYSIPDFEQKLIVDTTGFLDTVINLKTKFYMDYYIRVKAYNDSIESEWSHFKSFTSPKDTGHYPPLDDCWPIFPIEGTHLPLINNRFVWTRIKNAETYTLFMSTELNYKLGGHDVIYDITDTTYFLTSELQTQSKYFWWVIAHAKGWADSKKVLYHFFTDKRKVDVVDNWYNNQSLIPNPASDFIEIDVGEDNFQYPKEIRIYNTLGESVLSIKTNEGSLVQRIDISDLPGGMYFIKIENKVIKFVKI